MSARACVVAAALVLAACASSTGLDPYPIDASPSPDGEPPPPDAAPPSTGDSLPLGAISFFKTTKCPTGWVPFVSGEGRFLVPTVGTRVPGIEHGTPLASGEDRLHGHDLGAQIETGSVSYVGVVGGGNGGVAPAGTYGFQTAGEPAPSGLPYVQLLVCFKNAAPEPGRDPVPTGTLLWFRSNCPSGWTQAATTQGRWLVGVPADAASGTTFGGEPLVSDEQRAHTHGVNGQVVTSPHGIALASGCCGGGYARNDTYPFTTTTTSGAVDLPYVELRQCRKD